MALTVFVPAAHQSRRRSADYGSHSRVNIGLTYLYGRSRVQKLASAIQDSISRDLLPIGRYSVEELGSRNNWGLGMRQTFPWLTVASRKKKMGSLKGGKPSCGGRPEHSRYFPAKFGSPLSS